MRCASSQKKVDHMSVRDQTSYVAPCFVSRVSRVPCRVCAVSRALRLCLCLCVSCGSSARTDISRITEEVLASFTLYENRNLMG